MTLLICLLAVLPASAEPYLSLTLGINYSAMGFATMYKPLDGTALFPADYDEAREQAVNTLLEEARWIFSGMVYGFRFRYIPGNADEGFDELFELTPLHQIPRGDSGLEVYQVEDDYQNLQVLFYYWPDENQERRIAVSRGGGFSSSAAAGSVPMMLEGARIGSMEAAVKMALRGDLSSLIYNRPLEVEGIVYLSSSPIIRIQAGEYRSSLRILYRKEDLKTFPYNY